MRIKPRTQLTRAELLTWLIQECAEVIQAATKCQLHGFDHTYMGYGRNDLVLSLEVGDLLGVIEELGPHLTSYQIEYAKERKLERMLHALNS